MTWILDLSTGDLYGPDGEIRTTLDGPPYKTPDDVQKWAESQFRNMNMSDLTTDIIADYAEIWVGDIEIQR